jgi:hypothetical protein
MATPMGRCIQSMVRRAPDAPVFIVEVRSQWRVSQCPVVVSPKFCSSSVIWPRKKMRQFNSDIQAPEMPSQGTRHQDTSWHGMARLWLCLGGGRDTMERKNGPDVVEG